MSRVEASRRLGDEIGVASGLRDTAIAERRLGAFDQALAQVLVRGHQAHLIDLGGEAGGGGGEPVVGLPAVHPSP